MQTAEYDYTDFESSKQGRLDENLLVKFLYRTMPDHVASETQGTPMFKEVEYIDIKVPGDRDGIVRPARAGDYERFPRHYAAFKNRVKMPVEGIPLIEWGLISRSLAESFAFMNVKTVEQLAELNDEKASQIMGGNGFKQKAQRFLAHSKEVKDTDDKLELIRENKSLKEQIVDLSVRLDNLEEGKSPRKKTIVTPAE